jgi:hypothetical protein
MTPPPYHTHLIIPFSKAMYGSWALEGKGGGGLSSISKLKKL